jgi:tetratricopeptide (TPR) repeat protein
MHARTPKQEVALLVNSWLERAGIQKQQAAARVDMDYQGFYRAYLDPNRRLSADPDRTVAVVRAFTERCTEAERCRAAEAIRFCALTQLPLHRFEELRPLFPDAEWHQAFGLYLSTGAVAETPAAPGQGRGAAPTTAAFQAPLPALHRMPLARNPLFQGRGAVMRAVAQLLIGQAPTSSAVAITGIGGMGKTNLATELVYRYGPSFPGGVFWVSCADPRSLPSEVAACGGSGLVARDDWSGLPLEDQVRLVRLAWQEPIARLLVFDNCEDSETFAAWRPTAGGCRILMTSRRESWPRTFGVTPVPLRELQRAESVALLQCYRPDLRVDAPELAALADELGDLPLALHLAGSYLEANHYDGPLGDPAHFLQELRSADLIDHEALRGIDAAPSATDHELHVGRTFMVGLARLRLDDPVDVLAQRLLARVGHLAPNTRFPRELLPTLLGIPRDSSDAPRQVTRALRRLLALGFVSENETFVLVHPLVAAFARRVGDVDGARGDVERALIACVEAAYSADDVPTLRLLLPHMRRLADAALARGDETAVRLCNTLPFILEMVGDVPGGIPYFEHARSALEQGDKLSTQLGAEVLNNLAEWHRATGNLEAALGCHEQALAIRQRILVSDDPDIAQSANNLAELLRQQKRYAEALPYYEQALAIWSDQLGLRHVYTLTARSNLGSLLCDQGDYAAAEQHFQAVLAVALADLGSDDTRTARAHLNLGKALRGRREFDGAQAQLDVALAIFRTKLGDEHYETLRPIHLSALLLRDRGRPCEGADMLRDLLAICDRALGSDYPFTEIVRGDLRVLEAECVAREGTDDAS